MKTIYKNTVLTWFEKKIKKTDMKPLARAIEEGDTETMEAILSQQLMDTISFFDYSESYYHGFLAGLLKAAGGYRILSNRESGAGWTDLVMKIRRIRNGKAIILEIKAAKKFNEMEKTCRQALQQIEDRKYEEDLRREGYEEILKYGICFFRKECIVMKG